ncbi:MAG: lactate racemase domain-containing protein, partial [Planctomycetaceae bacterium]
GNACGLGMAEYTNQRTIDSVDRTITAINSITGGHPSAGALPIAFETDREAIDAALQTVGLVEPELARVVQIANTLHVGEVLVSEAFLEEVRRREDLEVIDELRPMQFDATGNLVPVIAVS